MTMDRRWWKAASLLAAAGLVLAACGDDDDGDTTSAEDGDAADVAGLEGAELVVGSKDFTEQLIVGEIARIALENAGASVTVENLAGTDVVRAALENGEVDMYWEYTGTGWLNILQQDEPIPDAQEQHEAVAEMDLEENGIVWLEPGSFNNTYAVAVASSKADELGLSALSDLQGLLADNPDAATFCVAAEFVGRPDGLPGMEEHYDIEFPDQNLVTLDEGLIYSVVAEADECTLGEVFATDGRIASLDLVVLEDDQQFFPVYNLAMTMREETYDEYPELADLFNPINAALDDETMSDLNARVDEGGEFEDEVAEDFLRENGFID
ncbi:MAG TPA: glycine betaine ABC transporter substrate-binding protein [Jiangellaceae bacterium]